LCNYLREAREADPPPLALPALPEAPLPDEEKRDIANLLRETAEKIGAQFKYTTQGRKR
jgi:hypothetical protein